MPNDRFSKFPSRGPGKDKSGPKRDSVSPIKTRKWPGPPGGTQTRDSSHGFKRMKNGATSKGV
jgi:hypothetical protein